MTKTLTGWQQPSEFAKTFGEKTRGKAYSQGWCFTTMKQKHPKEWPFDVLEVAGSYFFKEKQGGKNGKAI